MYIKTYFLFSEARPRKIRNGCHNKQYMELSSQLQERFEAATAHQSEYRPSPGVLKAIDHKTLVMIIAPAAMGKSHIISHAVAAQPHFAQTISFTTRDPRAGDEGNMRTIPRDEQHISTLLDLVEAGQVVNYAIFPTTGMLYGTDLSSYPGEINLMPTLANSVDTLRHTGFGRCISVGLIAPPETWATWFNARFPEPTQEKTARLKEALLSISWLLEDSETRWLINRDGETETVVGDLVALAQANKTEPNEQAVAYAQELRALITQMLQ